MATEIPCIEQYDILQYIDQTRRDRRAEEEEVLQSQVMLRAFREKVAGIIRKYSDPEICRRDEIIGVNYQRLDEIGTFARLGDVVLDCMLPAGEKPVQITLSASGYPSDRIKPGRIHDLWYTIEIEDYPLDLKILPLGGIIVLKRLDLTDSSPVPRKDANRRHLLNYSKLLKNIKPPVASFVTREREVLDYTKEHRPFPAFATKT